MEITILIACGHILTSKSSGRIVIDLIQWIQKDWIGVPVSTLFSDLYCLNMFPIDQSWTYALKGYIEF